MRKMFLLAATGLFLDFGIGVAEADGIRNRDVSTQREVSTGRTPAGAPAPAPKDPNQDNSAYGLAPGFVTPYGYPLPPYADGNNFQTIYTGR
jgi:hypothetical protein